MKRKEGDLVRFHPNGDKTLPVITGTICGIATVEQPVLGINWIVKLTSPLSTYQFSCATIFDCWILL